MKKICFLGGITSGGIGRVTAIITNQLLINNNYVIYALSYTRQEKEHPAYNYHNKLILDSLYNEKLSMKRAILSGGISKIRKYLIDKNIDILIACGALYFPMSVLSTKDTKIKCICWEHTNLYNKKDLQFQMISRKIAARYADLIVTLTRKDYTDYKEKFKKTPIVHIYNPLDPEVKQNTGLYNINSKKIISVGRLTYQKNFETLVNVAKTVLQRHKDWTWDIYGEGELQEKLRLMIEDYGIGDRMVLKGRVSNLYSVYQNYSMQVMSSRYEGFSMALLEGMANKLPLISFDVPTGPNEIIKNGENGYLIKPFDCAEMSNKVCNIIEDDYLRISMSKKQTELIRTFEIESIIKQWVDILQ